MRTVPVPGREAGTVIPLVLLCVLLAGLVVTASVAVSAALLARRQLTAGCDGAALAAATAVDPAALDSAAAAEPAGAEPAGPAGAEPAAAIGGAALPLDPQRVAATAARYRAETGADVTVATDGRTVTATCRRTARVPFGAVLGRPEGVAMTATARARSLLLPPAGPRPST